MLRKLWKRMRWSLRTQVIVVLFVGILALIWHRREPWVFVEFSNPPLRVNMLSQDKTRSATHGTPEYSFEITDEKESRILTYVNSGPTSVRYPSFIDNDTIAGFAEKPHGGTAAQNTATIAIYKRRFPEWWWGHFYRPEVWLLPLWLGLIVWTIRKDRAVPK